MLYNIKEISQELDISIVTVYRKLKLDKIKSLLINKDGKVYVDENGLKIIKQSLRNNNKNVANDETAVTSIEPKSNEIEEKTKDTKDVIIEILQNQVDDLKKEKDTIRSEKTAEISHLKEQIDVKDQQIATRDKHVENMQVLLKTEQSKNGSVLELPSAIKEHDIELVNTLLTAMQKQKEINQEQEQTKNKKGIFNNIFRTKV